tara:strand:+ start:2079 stop:2948 length:870 start_codon:yes stop_codon:yes gene_type:complete
MSSSADLKHSLERIDTLPAMPIIAQKLLALPLDTEKGEAELLKLIVQDSQISAKVIGLSNTALFGSPCKINSVSDATMRLGLTRVKSIAIGIATMSAFARQSEGRLKSMDLWAHNLMIAFAMRTIASYMPARMRPMDDQVFLAGLLHDIGYSALEFLDANASNILHEKLATTPGVPLLEIEHELIGTHHGEIGAQLDISWNLPEEVIAVMRYHHTPEDVDTEAEAGLSLVNLVNIAEKTLPDFGVSEHTAQEINEQDWINLGVDPDEVDVIVEGIWTVIEPDKLFASAG